MTKESTEVRPREQLMGEIEARITGMQYYEANVAPGEQIHLEREPDNSHDEHSIRVENGRFEPVGHLPRRLVSWLAPLIDAGKLRVDGYVPQTAEPNHNTCPVVLSPFLCKNGRHLLEKTEVHGKLDALHEVVRQAYEEAQEYSDPDLILGLADGLRPLGRQDLLPETRLLMKLMPAVAQEVRTAQAFRARGNMQELLNKVTIGEPIHHHNLTMFPLAWPEQQEPPYSLLATAIESGEAVVEEVDEDGEVPNLTVANHSDRPILIPEGEILIGAKQNRVVNVTVLVASKSTLKVPVSCVEQGRWQYRTRQFESAFCAPPSLRSKKMRAVHETRASRGTAEGDQGEVWEEVDACLDGLGVESETASLTDGFEAADEKLQEYRDRLQLPDDAAGVVVARGDKIIGMDLFGSSATLSSLWPRFSDAYFFDALRNRRRRKKAARELAAGFVQQAVTSAKSRTSALGLGVELEISGDGVVGAALLHSGSVCHVSAFSNGE
ncbi:MAG: HIRAN domain-containing protein [Planctomycetes bacterium]|nr:HIRAN domain-containing protein [Planctomycetota bacterium]